MEIQTPQIEEKVYITGNKQAYDDFKAIVNLRKSSSTIEIKTEKLADKYDAMIKKIVEESEKKVKKLEEEFIEFETKLKAEYDEQEKKKDE